MNIERAVRVGVPSSCSSRGEFYLGFPKAVLRREMSKDKSQKSGMLDPKRLQPDGLGRKSSLFSPESFHEDQLRKKEMNRSFVTMAQHSDVDTSGYAPRRPKVRYENTYRIEPERKFSPSEAEAIIKEVLELYLKDEKYDAKACRQLSLTLSQIIKDRVKELNYERYKIMCLVIIGQIAEQGMRVASRFCWDAERDTLASASFKNKSLFGIATVYAVYLE